MDLTREIGDRLRAVRLSRRLTLREAAAASHGRFRPSSIAGYERGERAISLQRFCDLAEVYGADPARLLDGMLRGARNEPDVRVDLGALDDSDEPAAMAVRSLARHVIDLRDEPQDVVVSLRRADLESLAAASGHPTDELLAMLGQVRERPSPG